MKVRDRGGQLLRSVVQVEGSDHQDIDLPVPLHRNKYVSDKTDIIQYVLYDSEEPVSDIGYCSKNVNPSYGVPGSLMCLWLHMPQLLACYTW